MMADDDACAMSRAPLLAPRRSSPTHSRPRHSDHDVVEPGEEESVEVHHHSSGMENLSGPLCDS